MRDCQDDLTEGSSEFRGASLRAWVRCERGSRQRLEDAWVASLDPSAGSPLAGFFAVFDGLGGEPNGEVAAKAAARATAAIVKESTDPRTVLEGLNRAVIATAGMTTAVLAIVEVDGRVVVAHAGDSIAAKLTDGMVQVLTPRHANHGRLDRFLGKPDLRVARCRFQLRSDESFLLCTDGVDGVVGVDRMKPLLQAASSQVPAELHRLFGDLRRLGAPDNATIVVVRREGAGDQIRRDPPTGP